MDEAIKNIFYPKSICVVGASTKQKSIGYEILNSIKKFEFSGNVFPVNPNADEILGYKCYTSILDIASDIDLAIVVVPKKFVDNSIDDLILKNVKSVILITAGFKETGEEGERREKELLAKLESHNIRMVGPNCMGIVNTLESIKLNATFVAEEPKKGGIGFLSQSGALGAAVLNSLSDTDIRLAHFISIGNKADISELDILDFWMKDPYIKTIAFYLESFENGFELIRRYRLNLAKKPLIVLKAGKTESGMKAASSHTGALSSNEKITDALLKQFGIIRADTLNEMFNTAKGYEHFSMPKGNRVAVVTNAGGPGILAVDKLEEKKLRLADLSISTLSKLEKIVHPEGSLNNPIDLLPGATSDIYREVNEIILQDENVDALISIFVEPVMVDAFEVIESVNSIKSEKPIYQVCMPLPDFWIKYAEKSNFNTPVFRTPEDPAEIIANLLHYELHKKDRLNFKNSISRKNFDYQNAGFLEQQNVMEVCKKYNIPVIESSIVSIEQIDNYDNFDFPIVVKGLNKTLIHKSELDAVKLNIGEKSEFLHAVKEIKDSFHNENYELEELMIQRFVDGKHELLVGGYRDPSFGPVIMFGSGGKYVEILDDNQIRSAYMGTTDLESIISNTKIGKILKGVRGERGIDINKLKMLLSSVTRMMLENENILEIDINPLVVDKNLNFFAVDVRIKSI